MNMPDSGSSSNNAERSDFSSSVTELSASVAIQSPPTSTEPIKSTVATIDNSVTTKEDQKVETAQVPIEQHNGEENPLVQCRCGCVPKNMMSLFQMAEKRARYQEEKRRKETEAAAQNLPQGRM